MSRIGKEPKNHLDNFDFCLRKAIAVHVFGKYTDETKTEFAKAMDTSQSTLSKWISCEIDEKERITPSLESRRVPNTAQIVLASAYLSMPISKMIDEAIQGEEESHLISAGMLEKMRKLSKDLHEQGVATSKRSEKRPPEYMKKVERTANSQYTGFFFQDDQIQHLIIETYEPYKSGSVPMTARIVGKAGNPYRGNVVSPPGNDHLYFYIRQEDGKNDRGLVTFYIDDDMQDTYKCGSGILLSTDRRSGKIRLQWVVIIRTGDVAKPTSNDTMEILREIQSCEQEMNLEDTEYVKTIEYLDQIIKPILEEEMPTSGNDILFENLRDRQEKLFRIYQSQYSDEIAAAEKRVAIAKIQYEKALAEMEEKKNETKNAHRN